MKPLTRVRQIAQYYRVWAEEHNDLAFGDNDLSGMCAHASFEIFCAMWHEGFSVQFCSNSTHCFVLWFPSDGPTYFIDVTATQFNVGLPKTIVRKYANCPRVWDKPWEIEHRANSPEEVKEILKDWPTEQQPRYFKYNGKLDHPA